MRFPADFKYSKEHEWARLEGGTIAIGVTDHAQSSLGDVVFIELPAVGRVLKKGETFGVVESIKAVSDLYAPIAGKVVEVNSSLVDDPSRVNREPHGAAWMIKLDASDAASLGEMMDSAAYSKYVESLK